MELLGPIVRLQVQLANLKVGEKPHQRFDPMPLTVAAGLVVTAGGVRGVDEQGEPLADVHHRDHPASKYRVSNAVSVGFTSHYRKMRGRFGERLRDGIAAENILVDCGRVLSLRDIASGLVIETRDGRRLALSDLIVAEPCVPFTRFAMAYPDEAKPDRSVTESLLFLGLGTRGFYAQYAGPEHSIAPGDLVYVR